MHCRATGLGTGGSRGSPGLGFGDSLRNWEPSLGPSSALPGPGSILSHNHGINWEFTPWGWSSSCRDKIYPTGDRSHPMGTKFTMWSWNSPCGDGIPSVGMELIPWGQNSSYGVEFILLGWNLSHGHGIHPTGDRGHPMGQQRKATLPKFQLVIWISTISKEIGTTLSLTSFFWFFGSFLSF